MQVGRRKLFEKIGEYRNGGVKIQDRREGACSHRKMPSPSATPKPLSIVWCYRR